MRVLKILVMTLLSVGTIQVSAKADDEKGIYLNAHLEKVKGKKSATYYCELVEETEHGFHYKVYFMSGELKMNGWYLDEEMKEPQGLFTYYYQSGQIESMGEYLNGAKFGLWERYTENGSEKAEKLYASRQMMRALEAQKQK